MFAILYGIALIAGGHALLRILPVKLSSLENWAASGVIGILVGTWVTFLSALTGIGTYAAWLTIVLAFAAMSLLWRNPRWHRLETIAYTGKFGLHLVGMVIVLIAWILLWRTHLLQPFQDGWYSGGYTWSDLALHMSIAAAFAYRSVGEVVAHFTLFPDVPLTYPFLGSYLSGLLVRLGGSWQLAFWLPSLILTLGYIVLSLGLVERLTGSRRAAWIHMGITLLSGSAWGVVLYLRDVPRFGWDAFLQYDYANVGGTEALHFANFLTSHLLPQRSYLFGIVSFFLVMILLLNLHEAKEKEWFRLSVVCGLLIGLLPFFHVHSYFVLVLLCGGLMVTQWLAGEPSRPYLSVLGFALLISLPQLLWQFNGSYHEGFSGWFVGWMRPENGSLLLFWIRNLGIALFLLPLGIVWLRQMAIPRVVSVLYGVGALLFLAGNLYQFQPNLWDNMKFFTYSYWLLSLPLAWWLARLSRGILGGMVAGLLVVLLTISGVLAVTREYTLHYQVASTEELQLGEFLRSTLPEDARILTSDRHNHPVPLLTGREIVQGYGGWLWSYGIPYLPVQEDVAVMFRGGVEAEKLFGQYKVTHVVVHEREDSQLVFNFGYYRNRYPLLYSENGWWVFEVARKAG